MDALKQTFNQFRTLFASMTASQRATLLIVPVLIAGAIFFLVQNGTSKSYVPLSLGKAFSAEEGTQVTRALASAGLTDFRQVGQQILVPKHEVERYNAALLAGGGLPAGWASEWEKKFDEQSSVFTSSEQLQNLKEIQLAKALRGIILGAPDIEDASVIWTPAKKHSWRNRSARTATVSVKPKAGRELSMNLVQGIRHAVAGAIDDLKPENVVVFDQARMTAFTPEKADDPYSSRVLNRIQEFTALYQRKIAEQLNFIPDVIVTVDVEIDNIQTEAVQKSELNPKTVVLSQRDRSRKDESSQGPAGAEGGVKANGPAAVPAVASSKQSTNSLETDSELQNAPINVSQTSTVTNGGMPKSVQVSVHIPKDYYRTVAGDQVKQTGTPEGTTDDEKKAFQDAINARVANVEQQVNTEVKETVRKAIPPQSPVDAVVVAAYVRGEPEVVKTDIPLTQTIGGMLSQWGGAIGLALFALWALRMMGKTAPKKAAAEEAAAADEVPVVVKYPKADEPPPAVVAPQPNKRDELQGIVRDNPEMTAAVLGRWLRSAN
jgi:flagellar biosynthesis/type III secretory pathway M-ring protein FliF/YscJ